MNKNRLMAEMALHGDNATKLAAYLGIARSTFYLKINEVSGSEFNQSEIIKIKEKYDLTPEQIDAIFFN